MDPQTSGSNDARAEGQGRVYQASGDQHITEHHHHAPDWVGPDSVRLPAVGRVPVVLRDRAAEMDRLRAAVEPGGGNRVYVLHGLGGCGKTAVAHALFQHATNHAGRIGLWVNASDPASLRAGMLAVAADRGATDGELMGARSGLRPAADLVWHYLDHSDRPWLLIIDNADAPAILRDGGWLRTSPAGIVVVTTRQAAAHWWPGAELLQFGVLPREEAALVLRDLAPHAGTVEEAAEVADRLGRLPLALTLAGGFLAHQIISPWTLADYGRRLGGAGLDPVELIDQGAAAVGDEDRQLISRTWQLSLDALSTQGMPEAGGLLRLLACWAGDPLPLSILFGVDLGPELPPSRVESALRGLVDHSLTEIVSQTIRCLRTHGVLLDSVARTIPAEQRERFAAEAARLLLAALPEVPDRRAQELGAKLLAPHVIALLRRLEKWAPGQSIVETAAECALRLVTAIHRAGDYASALSLATEAVEKLTPRLGEQHCLIIRLRQRMGRALFRLGRFEESKVLYQQVLDICEEVLGPEAPETLGTCLKLASPLINLDRRQDGVSLIRRSVKGCTRAFGPTHPLTLLARSSLLEMSTRQDDIAAGPALLMDCRREMGEAHTITLQAELNYAFALQNMGRSTDALHHARTAFTEYVRRFGPDYPIALNARHTLSAVLAALGHYAEAVEHAEALVAGRTKVLGPAHPWTCDAKELLDRCQRAGGRP